MRIASRTRSGEDIAQRTFSKKAQYERRLRERIETQNEQEILGCTFQPKLLMSSSMKSSCKSSQYKAGENTSTVGGYDTMDYQIAGGRILPMGLVNHNSTTMTAVNNDSECGASEASE